MYIQKLHRFCNISSPDDGPKSGRKYLGNKQLWKIYQSIPAEHYKINTAIWKDQQENMSIMFNEICINIYIYIYIYYNTHKFKVHIYTLSMTHTHIDMLTFTWSYIYIYICYPYTHIYSFAPTAYILLHLNMHIEEQKILYCHKLTGKYYLCNVNLTLEWEQSPSLDLINDWLILMTWQPV